MKRPSIAIAAVLCLLGWLGMACQAPSPPPTSIAPPSLTPSPVPNQTPTPGPLSDAEAIALIEEEATSRGVASHTLKITIGEETRSASIRYESPYRIDSSVFRAQTVLITLAVARTVTRVQPPINGGIRLAVMPAGEGEVGLRVIVIDWASLEAWANGSISDQEFVSRWTVGGITRE